MIRNSQPVTPKEAAVALCVADGLTCAETADRTGMKLESVRKALCRLRDKSGCRRKSALAVWVVQRRAALKRLAEGGGEEKAA